MQVNPNRTYLAARVWEAYRLATDTEPFGDVTDTDLPGVLNALAAKYCREQTTRPRDTAWQEWAHAQSHPAASLVPTWTEEQKLAFWVDHTANLFAQEHPLRAPRWITFHVEPTLARAKVIVAALIARVPVSCPVDFQLTEQRELPPERWLVLERELGEFDRHRFTVLRDLVREKWERHPLKRLHVEAAALSDLIPEHADLAATELEASKHEPGARADDDATALAARVAELPPAQQLAYRQFLEACAADPDLDVQRPTEDHHRHLLDAGVDVPKSGAWRKSASEALRKLFGPAKSRRAEATRSMVKAKDLVDRRTGKERSE